MGICIITDATIGVPKELREKLKILELVVPIGFDDCTVVEAQLSNEEFFSRLEKSDRLPLTSQPPYLEVLRLFDSILGNGDDIIGIFVSRRLSGIYNETCMVWNELKEKYTNSKVALLDSEQACMGSGYPVIQAAELAKKGIPFEEIVDNTKKLIRNANLLFVPKTLDNLHKGGRIGNAATLIGMLLEIRPVLYVNDGVVDVLKKCRGQRTASESMLHQVLHDKEKFGLQKVIVQYGGDLKQGEKLLKLVRDYFEDAEGLVEITQIMSIHVGAAIGIAYFTENK